MRLRRHARNRPPAALPFAPLAAWQARRALGLGVEQLAWSLACNGVPVPPGAIETWESGAVCPTDEQLLALARSLWCPVQQLLAREPRGLREWRLCRDLSRPELARRLRLPDEQLARLESAALAWPDDTELTQRLASSLELTPRELVSATGAEERLDAALRRAVAGRWRSHAAEVWSLVPVLHPAVVAEALESLSSQVTAAQLPWGASTAPVRPVPPTAEQGAPDAGPELSTRFWQLTESGRS